LANILLITRTNTPTATMTLSFTLPGTQRLKTTHFYLISIIVFILVNQIPMAGRAVTSSTFRLGMLQTMCRQS